MKSYPSCRSTRGASAGKAASASESCFAVVGETLLHAHPPSQSSSTKAAIVVSIVV